MEMDIYKVSLISIGLAICIVAVGVFMGISNGSNIEGTEVDNNQIYLTGAPSTEKVQETSGATKSNSTDKVKPQEEDFEKIDLRLTKNRLFFSILKNPSLKYSVLVTFDDVDSGINLQRLLRDLKVAKVNVTFFVKGKSLLENSNLWKQAVIDGHDVCNYTYSGKNIEGMTLGEFANEIAKWEQTANKVLGKEYVSNMKKQYPFFKFPGDKIITNTGFLRTVLKMGYRPVGWEISSSEMVTDEKGLRDEEKAQEVYVSLSRNSRPGSIISLKMNSYCTQYIREIINSINNKGLRVEPLSFGFYLGE